VTFRFLMSFHYGRGKDLQAIADAAGGAPVEVFADSGAFSAATLGSTIRLADYAAWLKDWQHLVTTAATLDVIGDPDATQRNTLALEDMGLKVLPVFHVGSPWERLEKLCAQYRYVALGGMVPYTRMYGEVMRWLVRCFRIGAAHGTVFHGFGQTNITVMSSLPFYSVDSSTWSHGAKFGLFKLFDGRAGRIVQVSAGNPERVRRQARLIRAHGADPAVVGRPGFGLKTGKAPEQFRREDRMMRGTPAVAYHRLGRWLQQRHDVAPPPGWTSRGTCLFLADTTISNFTPAAQAIAADLRKETP
jgi:hypothetical protein